MTQNEKLVELLDAFSWRNGESDEDSDASMYFIDWECKTIADYLIESGVVIPVRCKDCKWCHAGYCERYDDLIPFGRIDEDWENWFCAHGERRTHERVLNHHHHRACHHADYPRNAERIATAPTEQANQGTARTDIGYHR